MLFDKNTTIIKTHYKNNKRYIKAYINYGHILLNHDQRKTINEINTIKNKSSNWYSKNPVWVDLDILVNNLNYYINRYVIKNIEGEITYTRYSLLKLIAEANNIDTSNCNDGF